MITAGWNLLRFTRKEITNVQVRGTKCIQYQFAAINLAYEEVFFVYLVPEGFARGQIIKDLEYFNNNKKWVDVMLIEKNKTLMIRNMQEGTQPQEEIKTRKPS